MAHPVKCTICGETFDRDKIEAIKVNSRRYAHKSCCPDGKMPKKKTEKEQIDEVIEVAKEYFGDELDEVRTRSMIRKYVKENGFTYSGIIGTIHYWYGIKGGNIDKSNHSLGIIAYQYEDARRYFNSINSAHEVNKKIVKIEIPTFSVSIHRPQSNYTPSLFSMEEEAIC